MADLRQRTLARAAAAGDVEAQARELLERVRAGTLTRERLELAAYCGETVCRLALSWPAMPTDAVLSGLMPDGPRHEGSSDGWERGHLSTWVKGLAHRWPPEVLVLVAWATVDLSERELDCRNCDGRGWEVIDDEDGPCSGCGGSGGRVDRDYREDVRDLLSAGWTWLDASETDRPEIARQLLAAHNTISSTHAPVHALIQAVRFAQGWPACRREALRAITGGPGTRLVSDPMLREAIARRVSRWALGPAPAAPAPHVDPDPELPPTPAAELAPHISTPLSQPREEPHG